MNPFLNFVQLILKCKNMTAQEIKNKIDSISFYENKYIKSNLLNLCDAILESNLLNKNGKVEVEKVKAAIKKIKDPWLWNNKPDLMDLRDIQNNINELYRIIE
jgi:hypothetical protein